MTEPPMYNVASAVFCRSLAIVRSLPLPGCDCGSRNRGMTEMKPLEIEHIHFISYSITKVSD